AEEAEIPDGSAHGLAAGTTGRAAARCRVTAPAAQRPVAGKAEIGERHGALEAVDRPTFGRAARKAWTAVTAPSRVARERISADRRHRRVDLKRAAEGCQVLVVEERNRLARAAGAPHGGVAQELTAGDGCLDRARNARGAAVR